MECLLKISEKKKRTCEVKASFLNYIVACDDDCHDDRLQDGTEDEDNDNFHTAAENDFIMMPMTDKFKNLRSTDLSGQDNTPAGKFKLH